MLAVNAAVAIGYAGINPDHSPVVGKFDFLPSLWPYLIFSQNLLTGGEAWNHGWYGISWSLSVEEWFYLLFPLVLLAFRRVPLTRLVLVFSVTVIAAMLSLRAARYLANGPLHFDDMYRRAVFLRLDAFCYGALCYLAMRHYGAWIATRRHLLLLAGLAIITGCYVNAPSPGRNDAFTSIFFWALVPAAFALMLPYFSHLAIPHPLVRAAVRFVSTRTYSLYLWHLLVGLAFTVIVTPITLVTLLPLLAANALVADLSYRLIERPFLRLRPNDARQVSETSTRAIGPTAARPV